METLPKDEIDFTHLTDQAFSNRWATDTDSGKRLLVEIPDEDGYAGYLEGLHGLGIVQVGDELIIEADYNHRSRKNRIQDLIKLNLVTQELDFTRYSDGQTELEPTAEEKARRIARMYLLEAVHGVGINKLTDTQYNFFSPELQPATGEVVDDKDKEDK